MNASMVINPRSGKVILNITDYDMTKAVRAKLDKSFIVKAHNRNFSKLITVKRA